MSKVSKKILDKIEKEKIQPRPKWQFIAMHVLMFVLFGFSILLGAIAVSVILFKVVASDWAVVPRLPGGPLIVLPYLWILIFGVMMVVASILFEKTDKGYKYNLWLVAIASIVLSIVIGSILFAIRLGEGVEDGLRQHFKPYREYVEMREEVWHAPEKGVLPGKIIKIDNRTMIILDDFSGNKWEVNIEDAILPKMELREDQLVVVVGKRTGESEFYAEGIKPGNVLKDRFKKPQMRKNGFTQ
jgi:hypothetical protein